MATVTIIICDTDENDEISVQASSDPPWDKEDDGEEFTAAQCDYDGDSMTDPSVYREVDGYWVVAASSKQYAEAESGHPGPI